MRQNRFVGGILGDMLQRFRDLLVMDFQGRLVIACDSVGGIGPKPADTIHVDARTLGHFALRVPLLEVVCSGARPLAVVNTLCVENDPTGEQMITEIRTLAAAAGVDPDQVTGSTEENVPTQASGVGITVLGALEESRELGRAQAGDVVVCLGLPISAPQDEIYIGHPAQITIDEVRAVIDSGLVHDALPVGSRGVGYELDQMAETAGLQAARSEEFDLERSGGPASCVLVACRPASVGPLIDLLDPDRPFATVARLDHQLLVIE